MQGFELTFAPFAVGVHRETGVQRIYSKAIRLLAFPFPPCFLIDFYNIFQPDAKVTSHWGLKTIQLTFIVLL